MWEEEEIARYIEDNFISNSKQAIEYVRQKFQKSYSMSGMVYKTIYRKSTAFVRSYLISEYHSGICIDTKSN